jgi:hypothetical protein
MALLDWLRTPSRGRKNFFRLLSLIVLVAMGYQFFRLGERMDWPAFFAALGRPGQAYYLLLALLMMPVNWLLEARKWQLLLRPFLPWSYARTLRATLAGVSVSAATPNRIGEIGGRMLVAGRAEWAAVVGSSLLGSLCQWVAFLLIAWPALIYTLGRLPEWTGGAPLLLLFPLGPLAILLIWIGGKSLALRLLRWVRSRFGRDTNPLAAALANVNFRLMSAASAYAALRFGVYCTQLYLLLWFFGLELPLVDGLAGIAAIYLVQAGLPLPPGMNLVLRTELGLLLWPSDPAGAIAVLAAYTALFGVNVLLPALPGYWWIVRKNRIV